jgi:hypothetical protein
MSFFSETVSDRVECGDIHAKKKSEFFNISKNFVFEEAYAVRSKVHFKTSKH